MRACKAGKGVQRGRRWWPATACMWAGLQVLAACAWAQSSAPGVPAAASGTGNVVSGRVVCADTQRAARFAQITLIPASDDDDERGRRFSARTDLDGNYGLVNVPAGDYYVTAQMTGYVNETMAVEQALNAPTPTAPPPDIPEVHVMGGGASVDLSLERGGVIAGTVAWDDGSPAAGVQVSVLPAAATGTQGGSAGLTNGSLRRLGLTGFFGGAQTDDRGRFRLSGLAPGVYVVRASVQAPAPGFSNGFQRTLSVAAFAPDKPRRAEAIPITITGGDEHNDVGIVIGLGAMHTVSGVIGSSGAAVRSGTVNLTDQTDASLSRTGTVNADGSFTVPYVPAGSYTLRANASANPAPVYGRGISTGSAGTSSVAFQPLQMSVTVTDSDVTGLNLNVTPVTGTP